MNNDQKKINKIAAAIKKARGSRKQTDIVNQLEEKGFSLTYGYLGRIESGKCTLEEATEVAEIFEEITGQRII